jgi:hypothetical protein
VKPDIPQSGSVWRLAGRTLATPVLWYEHGDRRRLIVILNTHIAAGGYFATMRACIAALAARGWSVQLEGFSRADPAAWAGAADDERAARQVMLDLYRDRPRATARRLGWVYQGDKQAGFRREDTWRSGDLTDLEIIRLAGPDVILDMGRAYAEGLARFGSHAADWEAACVPFTYRMLARPHAPLSAALAGFAPEVHDVLVGGRSRHAVRVLDPDRNSVIAWGSEHADTLHAALYGAGWRLTGKRRWLTVGQLPPYARSLAGLFTVAWRAAAEQAPDMTVGDALRQARQDWQPAREAAG